ncbi:MAG: DUF2642 domain-containing protein [Clostridia bacterium]|nr:MAG: DUF2642 domain-containing protein [Clostridia bacterium]
MEEQNYTSTIMTAEFLAHLRQLRGHMVEVAAMHWTIQGTLREVFSDHILVQTDMGMYHIRIPAIAYVREL